ncbi:MAG: VWA domain-containing protein, partial [Kofleriaceae bacterium]|nr:VWA domain-containing protein [Kofleriaceae bacterium]
MVLLFGFCATAHAQLIQDERTEAQMIATGQRDPMPVVEERLRVDIDGEHATTTLLQVYQNNTGGQVEGRYSLRAGMNSHVDGFAYWNGEQKIVGEVFEKQLARQVYDNVTTRRRDPGLLEQDGEGAFSFKVFPIAPQEKKRVELRWTRWLDRRGKTVTFRAPVTRADAEVVVSIDGAVKSWSSPTHRLKAEKTSSGIRLRSEGGRSTGELIVKYDVDEADWTPQVYIQPGGKHDGWFALSLAAPPSTDKQVAAKDVTIVVDRSGSMTGDPMEHALAAAMDMVRMLDDKDRVNVVAFSDEVDPLFAEPHTADAETKKQALQFIQRMHAGGGTDIALALKTAIKSQDKKGENPKVVVFMTDGQSDTNLAINAANADTGDVRLFTLGLGKDVNKPLLQRLASQKRGRFTYIETAGMIEPEVRRLASSIAKPVLVGIEVEVDGAQAVRLYPRSISDLFAEDEMVITGRIRGTGTAKFHIKGRVGGKTVTYTRAVDLAKASAHPWVGALWAQARVDHLLEELALGATAPELKDEVLELALAYNFVTPYTSFLAIPESELGAMKST